MKKIFWLLMFCIPLSGMAQLKIGVRGGVNLSSIQFFDYDPEKRVLPRVNVGAMIEIPFDDNWSLYTGPYYSGQGVIIGRSFETGKIDSVTISLNYIKLPVNIGYKFFSDNESRFMLSTGPYLSYGFNGKIIIRNSQRTPTEHLHKKETDKYKRLDAGFHFIAAYQMKQKYGLLLEYSKSMFNIERVGKEKNILLGISFFLYFGNR